MARTFLTFIMAAGIPIVAAAGQDDSIRTARTSDVARVQIPLTQGADPGVRTEDDATPLRTAAATSDKTFPAVLLATMMSLVFGARLLTAVVNKEDYSYM